MGTSVTGVRSLHHSCRLKFEIGVLAVHASVYREYFCVCLCCSEIAILRKWSPLDFIYGLLGILLSVGKEVLFV